MLNRNALILALGLWSMAATAQVPVVEAGRGGQPAAQVQPQGNELLLTLYNQVEALQQEIQTLRGMVEEQGNQLRRMQTEQRDRYLDVDRRLSELSGDSAATVPGALPGATDPGALPGANPGVTTTLPPATTAGAPVSPPLNDPQLRGTTPAPVVSNPAPVGGVASSQTSPPSVGVTGADAQLGERELYSNALNMLLEQKPENYPESIRMFRSYIERYPQGRLLTNAYYWLGEALILVEQYAEARDVFTLLITNYPDDPKAAGAMLKRGDVYQRMGDRAAAEQDWREIATRYPENATEIREAQSRLRGE
jgi:tol-pal system protein YbgF